jgi:hypothetical protein
MRQEIISAIGYYDLLLLVFLFASSALVSTHRATYFKTTLAMRADTIRCICMITSIACAYGIQWLCVIHVSDFKPQSTITNLKGVRITILAHP